MILTVSRNNISGAITFPFNNKGKSLYANKFKNARKNHSKTELLIRAHANKSLEKHFFARVNVKLWY